MEKHLPKIKLRVTVPRRQLCRHAMFEKSGKSCALGWALRALGFNRDSYNRDPRKPEKIIAEHVGRRSVNIFQLIQANDEQAASPELRFKKVAREGRKLGIAFRFV